MTTAAVLRDEDGNEIAMELTPVIGSFKCYFLLYIKTITEVDISACRNLDVTRFTESIVCCTGLQKIVMKGCTQFTQNDLLNMLSKLPNLKYFNIEGCKEMSIAQIMSILNLLPKLQIQFRM